MLSDFEIRIVKAIEALLKISSANKCSVCRILTHVCANHLFSDESDECHIDGKEFGEQIDQYGIKSLTESTK